MPEGFIPGQILSGVALATIVTLMFHLGTLVTPGEVRAAWRSPGLMLKALFCSVVAVPVIVVAVARAFELPREVEIGMVLMAICPGAPIALRRALGAGGGASFAIALQVSLAFLAVVAVPAWVAVLDEVYAGSASVTPNQLAGQVLLGQLLPLALGFAARGYLGARIVPLQPSLGFVSTLLLLALLTMAMVNAWQPIAGTGMRVGVAIAVATSCALLLGHLLGGPEPGTRTALAVACAARNAGLAMIVAIVNNGAPSIKATLLGYLAVSALAITPYVLWRTRAAQRDNPSSQRE
jgi:BASS family bile acid:Na+ symporter